MLAYAGTPWMGTPMLPVLMCAVKFNEGTPILRFPHHLHLKVLASAMASTPPQLWHLWPESLDLFDLLDLLSFHSFLQLLKPKEAEPLWLFELS